MAQKVLSFPFKIGPNQLGRFSVIEQGTDLYKAQQVEAFVRTERGERPIFQDFGIEDPTFNAPPSDDSWNSLDLLSDFSLFYPNIGVADLVTTVRVDGTIEIEILYD